MLSQYRATITSLYLSLPGLKLVLNLPGDLLAHKRLAKIPFKSCDLLALSINMKHYGEGSVTERIIYEFRKKKSGLKALQYIVDFTRKQAQNTLKAKGTHTVNMTRGSRQCTVIRHSLFKLSMICYTN